MIYIYNMCICVYIYIYTYLNKTVSGEVDHLDLLIIGPEAIDPAKCDSDVCC